MTAVRQRRGAGADERPHQCRSSLCCAPESVPRSCMRNDTRAASPLALLWKSESAVSSVLSLRPLAMTTRACGASAAGSCSTCGDAFALCEHLRSAPLVCTDDDLGYQYYTRNKSASRRDVLQQQLSPGALARALPSHTRMRCLQQLVATKAQLRSLFCTLRLKYT